MTSANDNPDDRSLDSADVDLEYLPQDELTPYQDVNAISADREIYRRERASYQAHKRRQFRTSVILFVLTLGSTFLVGSNYIPFRWIASLVSSDARDYEEKAILTRALLTNKPPQSLESEQWDNVLSGLMYAIPLMTILFCHEMGHYLLSVRHRVPASFPYFIPLPLPPLGTMGAVILQGRGVATRRQMFDIAVAGPIAGLVVTIPVLILGIYTANYVSLTHSDGLEFGEPLLSQWLIHWIHGPGLPGQTLVMNGLRLAGWVGIFITAMNLLPVGQLDGGHILYTLIGRKAHAVAYLVIAGGVAMMFIQQTYTFSLLFILLMLTGLRHPPTANDSEPLGKGRMILGWLTLSFLIIGFTPTPIAEGNRSGAATPAELAEPVAADYEAAPISI